MCISRVPLVTEKVKGLRCSARLRRPWLSRLLVVQAWSSGVSGGVPLSRNHFLFIFFRTGGVPYAKLLHQIFKQKEQRIKIQIRVFRFFRIYRTEAVRRSTRKNQEKIKRTSFWFFQNIYKNRDCFCSSWFFLELLSRSVKPSTLRRLVLRRPLLPAVGSSSASYRQVKTTED